MNRCEILITSCDKYSPYWPITIACRDAYWPGAKAMRWNFMSNGAQQPPSGADVIDVGPDRGWCANLIHALDLLDTRYVLWLLDDLFPAPQCGRDYSANICRALDAMDADPIIGSIRLGYNHQPEIPYPAWDHVREYDREPHPFKRCSCVSGTIYRVSFWRRLAATVLARIGSKDWNREFSGDGLSEFEVEGTLLTSDARAWPERILGCDRERYPALLDWIMGDYASHRGKLILCNHAPSRALVEFALLKWSGGAITRIEQLPGIVRFLPAPPTPRDPLPIPHQPGDIRT